MSNKDFDKKVKTTVDNHPSSIDVDAFWASIEGEVKEINANKKKKRKLPFYFFTLGILLFASTLLGLLFINKNKEKISFDDNLKKQNIEINENKNVDLVSFEEKIIEEKVIQNQKNGFPKNTKPFPNDPFSNPQKIDSSVLFDKKKNSNFILENKNTEAKIPAVEKTSKIILTQKTKNQIDLDHEKVILQHLNSSILFLDKEYEKLNPRYINRHQKSWKFNIGFQGGVNFASKQLDNINPESEPYASLRNETETSKTGFQIGLRTGVKYRSGLTFSTGINYTQINEQFQFQGSTFKQVLVENGIIGYEISINMDTIPIFGDFGFTQEIIHNKNFRNQYRLLEIPLLIGYQKDFKKWAWGIQGGVFANFSVQTVGMIFTPNNEFAFLENDQDEYFYSNIGVSYYLGGEGKYLINDNIALTFSPHFRFSPKSFSNNEKGIRQKYSLTGLNLGVDFDFDFLTEINTHQSENQN